jgi:hypothetical protein
MGWDARWEKDCITPALYKPHSSSFHVVAHTENGIARNGLTAVDSSTGSQLFTVVEVEMEPLSLSEPIQVLLRFLLLVSLSLSRQPAPRLMAGHLLAALPNASYLSGRPYRALQRLGREL